ncbi:unnamed protein product [Notodromas monacha]|uniref:Protein HGH1 homolog n=1 Tax=Notodromas monacha TaxID=399045 RepID=A0A7R9BTA3_9CRUS|nr:unnamed protein product [Notodromas monacha]CAG0921351.1 unnamed protein product [Notodromas monacha]
MSRSVELEEIVYTFAKDPRLITHALQPNAQPDLQDVVLKTLAADADEKGNWSSILEIPGIVKLCVDLIASSATDQVIKRILQLFLNVSADEKAVSKLYADPEFKPLIHRIARMVADPDCKFADLAVSVLVNASRAERDCSGLLTLFGDAVTLPQLLEAFSKPQYNREGQSLHLLAHVFGNLTQLEAVQDFFVASEKRWIFKLLPFLSFEDSLDRRLGCAAALKNCCFKIKNHEFILSESESEDILPHILLPLAGPETFDDEENDSLPLDLQFLPDSKVRESNPVVRRLLLEALLLLCVTKVARETLRRRGVYYILREYHKWELVPVVKAKLESVIHILIRTEDEIGTDNLSHLEIPDHLVDALDKEHEEEAKELVESESVESSTKNVP